MANLRFRIVRQFTVAALALLVVLPSSAAAQVAGTTFPVHIGEGSQYSPRAAFDTMNHRYLVAWTSENYPDFAVRAQLVQTDGQLAGGVIDVTGFGILGSPQHAIAFAPTHSCYIVVYRDTSWPYCGTIGGQLVNADGSLQGGFLAVTPFPVPPNYECTKAWDPAVAYSDLADRFLIVFVIEDGAVGVRIGGQFLLPGGTFVGAMINISDTVAYCGVRAPDIAYDASRDRFLVTWQFMEGDSCGRFVGSDGTLHGPEMCFTSGKCSSNQLLVYDPSSDRFFIGGCTAGMIDGEGALIREPIEIGYDVGSATLDHDHSKFFAVDWGGTYHVWGQMINPDGTLYGKAFRACSSEWADGPQVFSGSGSGESLVLWTEAESNSLDHDIFGAFVGFRPCPADFDANLHVDGADLVLLEACSSGPSIPAPAGCDQFDFDHDQDVDQTDFGIFQRCYRGEDAFPDPDCAG